MQKLMGLVRRCVDDYNMIEAGDKIAVGVDIKDGLVAIKGIGRHFIDSLMAERAENGPFKAPD